MSRYIASAFLLLLFTLTGCSGSVTPSSGFAPPTRARSRVLVVGHADGPAFAAISQQYAIDTGSGSEAPDSYDMAVFDCNAAAQNLRNTPAIHNFLKAGKAIVLLNNTAPCRETALHGSLFAYAKVDSPGSILYFERSASGKLSRAVDIEFPRHVLESIDGTPSQLHTPTSAQFMLDAVRWLASFQARFSSGGTGNIAPANAGSGQMIESADTVQLVDLSMPSRLNTVAPGNGLEFCGNVSEPNGPGSCNGQNPNITDSVMTADFETMVYVLLESAGSGWQYNVIARQYAFLNTYAWPGPSWDYGYYMADAINGTNNANIALKNFLGFNVLVALTVGPGWPGMSNVEAMPQNTNDPSWVATSNSQTQYPVLSVNGGYDDSDTGTIETGWTGLWTWNETSGVNLAGWISISRWLGNNLQFNFSAQSGTPDTYPAVANGVVTGSPQGNNGFGYNPPQTPNLMIGGVYLNALQASRVIAQDETTWVTPSWSTYGTPTVTGEQTFNTSAEFVSGEVYEMPPSIQSKTYNYGNLGIATVDLPISIDFSSPALALPSEAPWVLTSTVQQYPTTTHPYFTYALQAQLAQPATTPVTMNLTYVVAPQQSLTTWSGNGQCPGEKPPVFGNPFINPPPLSLTIPAGQTTETFTVNLRSSIDQYYVQVVSWQPPNAQSATCLNPNI